MAVGAQHWRAPLALCQCRECFGAEEISPDYLEALLTYEDRGFRYPTVNTLALLRAAWQNLFISPRIEPCPRAGVLALKVCGQSAPPGKQALLA